MDGLILALMVLLVVVGPWVVYFLSNSRRKRELEELRNDLNQTSRRLDDLTQMVLAQQAEARRKEELTAAASARARPVPAAPPPIVQPAEAQPVIQAARPEPVAPGPAVVAPAPAPTPPSFSVLEPASPSFGERLGGLLNLEEILGTNWLNRLGIIILVIGVALFLAYQLRELGPAGKVTSGYAISLAMLGAGVFFERRERWRRLSQAGIAGGWALVYFTTYAMHHVPAARVLSSEPVDLALLLVAASAMVAHTLRYRSRVVTLLAFLLAFTTVNISRGDALSLLASGFLCAGLAWVVLRRRWFEIEIVGMAVAYLNHYLWLRPIIEPMQGRLQAFPEYTASALLLTGYWLIFRASYLLRQISVKREEQISTVAALLNPALFMSVMGYQSVHPERAFHFFLSVGVVELLLGQLSVARGRRAAFVILTTLGSALVVAAFPYRYSGAPLTVSWLAEAEVFFLAGVFLREILFRRLGMLMTLLVWMYMMGALAGGVFADRRYGVRLTDPAGLSLLFGAAAAALYANAHWVPRRWPGLIQTGLENLCLRRLSHMAGILAFIAAWMAWPEAWTSVAWMALALALAFAGQRWSLPEVSVQAMGGAAGAVLRVLVVNLGTASSYPSFPWMSKRLITVCLVAALLYVACRWAGVGGMVSARRVSPAYTWAGSALLGLLAWYELRPVGVGLGWTLLGLVLLELGLERHSVHLRLQAYAAFAASFLRLFLVNLNAAGETGELTPRVYTTVPLALAFYYVYGRLAGDRDNLLQVERSGRAVEGHCFLGTLTLAALMRFELDLDLVVAAWAALILALVAIAWWTGQRIFLHQGLLLAFMLLFRATLHNFYQRSYFPAPPWHGRILSVGVSVVLLFLVLSCAFALRRPASGEAPQRRLARMVSALDRHPEQVFFLIPFFLLTTLLALEVRSGLVTLAWGVEAVAVFLFALLVQERSYRLCGLGLLLLCVGKIVARDVWRLAPRDRYLTFIVLGFALLAVSFLYTRYREVLRRYL